MSDEILPTQQQPPNATTTASDAEDVPEKTKTKDNWDKAGVIAQICSGIIIGLLGMYVTTKINGAQQRATNAQYDTSRKAAEEQSNLQKAEFEHQLALSRQVADTQSVLETKKQAADYIEKIESSPDQQVRADLMKSLDIITDSPTAVRIAFQYAYPNKNEGDNLVAQSAVGVLKRQRKVGYDTLIEMAKNANLTDLDDFTQVEMANAIVKNKDDRLFVRVSDIDDFVDVTLNGKKIDGDRWRKNNDSGWRDLTKEYKRGSNLIEFVIRNSPFEGCGGHFQISAGSQQYDYVVYLKSCPPNRAAFRIDYSFDVLADGRISLHAPNTVLRPYVDWNNCVKGCVPIPDYRDPDESLNPPGLTATQ